jgi:hypothetical protein
MSLTRRPDPQRDSLSAACSPVWSCFGQVSHLFIPPLHLHSFRAPLHFAFLFPFFSCPLLLLSFRCVLRVALRVGWISLLHSCLFPRYTLVVRPSI